MPFIYNSNGTSVKSASIYTANLDNLQIKSLYEVCVAKHFDKHDVAHAVFAFRGNGLNIVCYKSGKLVIQGKKTVEFVQYELEPHVIFTAGYGYDEVIHPEWFESHAGMDESGKGDLFGPLVTACVIAGNDVVKEWMKIGIKDSKKISNEETIFALEKKILKSSYATNIMTLEMEKYNELYKKFGSNMNILLGWMHSCSLRNALNQHRVSWGLLDQFSKRPIVQMFLKDETFDLRMQTKAELDPVVAAASILARAEYIRQINRLSGLAGFKIQKGASKITVEQANNIANKFGYEILPQYIKMHFATAPKT